MEETEKNDFKIGELSELFHVGTDSIRYYEKIGLLHPVRDPDNNYRRYTIDDVRTMNTIRELLSLGFSTEEILRFEQDRNLSHVTEMLEKEEGILNEQIIVLKKKREEIRGRLKAIAESLQIDCSGEVSEREFPERKCLKIIDGSIPDSMINYQLARFTNGFLRSDRMDKISTIGACDCYTLDLASLNESGTDYRTKNVFFYSPYLKFETNFVLPAGTYLCAAYRGEFSKSKKLVPRMLQYAARHQMTVLGDPMEFCRIDRYETEDTSEYLTEIELPVISRHPQKSS